MAQTASEGRYGITKKLLNKLRGIPADFNYASVLSSIQDFTVSDPGPVPV